MATKRADRCVRRHVRHKWSTVIITIDHVIKQCEYCRGKRYDGRRTGSQSNKVTWHIK